MIHLEEYNKNKKVEQLIQENQLLVMDTREMTDDNFITIGQYMSQSEKH